MAIFAVGGGHGAFSPLLALVIGIIFLAYPMLAWLVTRGRWADGVATVAAFLFGVGFILSAILYWKTH